MLQRQQQLQQQQQIGDASSLLTATRLAQSLANLTPTGASSASRAQVIESIEQNIARQQQQQQQQQRQRQIVVTRELQPSGLLDDSSLLLL